MTDLEVPAFLKRETNKKGVTLSAGIVAPTEPTIVATGAKTGKKPKKLSKAQRMAKVVEAAPVDPNDGQADAALASAEITGEPLPVVEQATTPTTANPALVLEDGEVKPLEKVSRSIVPMRFKAKYAKNAGTCGDDMALELKAATTTRNSDKREVLDVEALWAIAKANEIDVEKYLLLNNGQKRMNVGNKLRGKLNQGGDVVIGSRTFRAEDWTPRH